MEPTTGSNPTNNPRLDLLHNTGDNQQLKGAAGSYTPDASRAQVVPASAGPAPAPAMLPRPVPVPAPAPQPSPVAKEELSLPSAPRPVPTAQPSGQDAVAKGSNVVLRAAIIIAVLLVVAAGGVGGWWYLTKSQTKTETPPTTTKPKATVAVAGAVSGLAQEADGAEIASGSTTKSNAITFTFTLPTTASSGSVTPEIELRPADADFTGQPTTIGQAVDATGHDLSLSIQVNDLTDGAYHWQVRAVSGEKQGAWVIFGNDPTVSSFTIASAAAVAAAPTPPPAAAPQAVTPPPAATPPLAATPPAAAPAAQTLAPTGDSTLPLSIAALGVMVLAAGGWVWTRRRYAKG